MKALSPISIGTVRVTPTSIVVVNWNTPAMTSVCLERIRRYTRMPYELIVVDNGSTDDSAGILERAPGVSRLVRLASNYGFAGGYNRGIEAADPDNDVVLLNSDAFVTRGWLGRMSACMARHRAGLVGPCTNRCKGKQRHALRVRGLFRPWFRRTEQVDFLSFFCVLISRAVIRSVGLLDERFTYGMFEDDDYCRRAGAAGFSLFIDGRSWVWHEASATFAANQLDLRTVFDANRRQFEGKWQS
jgi:GT2 family glycosyltransferase